MMLWAAPWRELKKSRGWRLQRVDLNLLWYDLWVGVFWKRKKHTLYVCLLPCVVLAFKFRREHVQ
jgi:hypothetical protein